MTGSPLQLSLVFAWIWILCGFASGALMGMRFQDENWLGGYSSFPRRLYRLGHISFFGLGMVNFVFYLTFRGAGAAAPFVSWAAWAFIAGGVLMPVCCLVMAHWPKASVFLVFSAPVSCLLAGGGLTLYMIAKP